MSDYQEEVARMRMQRKQAEAADQYEQARQQYNQAVEERENASLQILGKGNRPVLQATRIQSFLDNKTRLFHRTQERLRKRLGEKILLAHTRLNTHASGLLD